MKAYTRQILAFALALVVAAASAFGDNRNVRGSSRSSVNRNVNSNTNVSRNTNVNVNRNTNVNINRDVDVHVHGSYRGGGCCYSSGAAVAAAVVTTAVVTAAVVGTRVTTLPPSCTVLIVNGITYQQCAGAYYQPQFVNGSTTYIVVNAPR